MNQIKNCVTLIGHLGQDPRFITTQSGRSMLNLSLATNDTYRNQQGERVTTTEWHRCIAWGKLAEWMNNVCKKGGQIAIRGKLTYNSYEDKEGIRRNIPAIIISEFTLFNKENRTP
ncbi:MAG: single-stranded DNA-binding protein [Phaeodactylibacter sp.]|nr:single-stranded DNA-binding protein [Phaeodactylibacter sp.]MCB9276477.1 single-stranded DNA-binding protein [Lewinellaceae bacterium]